MLIVFFAMTLGGLYMLLPNRFQVALWQLMTAVFVFAGALHLIRWFQVTAGRGSGWALVIIQGLCVIVLVALGLVLGLRIAAQIRAGNTRMRAPVFLIGLVLPTAIHVSMVWAGLTKPFEPVRLFLPLVFFLVLLAVLFGSHLRGNS